ncbi:glycerol-3-phosphate dehydrogenase [Listeria monocytogenes]|uniref:Glycerol-3-phosphate dehydrogenase n=1 Tax=Listeria monocytogenes TaxID=1639 RepID=A0A468UB16_LISMN|nr:glycerol-3-phosphate dehydrogenase/oxidase [Listeria monocytogenes]EAF4456616.1 glycerol-3-phosphate dehydrogenase/oxidase [Listeria monocytogenes serotype 1/2a]EEP3929160.1 glycerol-3-phosphate dehydrogenase/oxidase [Listeria monocytogenes serotype 4ab]EFD89822.1 glycerol-3-phosphate dehydrogenase [Listeria monocytogenes FSL J2-071]MDA21012.1 glycerol-3-phosphate dehydrogenase/oxidase [Listeria monocytogenes serotype 4a]ALQ16373.1 glycerol-3-phosphate dehydrogenase [Listeria monocytogenes]
MVQLFSAFDRETIERNLQEEKFDLVIVGGGITGAGIALDATSRGMSVALVEMGDFASGTSSRSTKLVHGGLRYLQQFEIKEVADLGKERAIVYENGPHVTTPEWMMLPFHKGGNMGKTTASFGIRLYDYLAGVKKNERRKILSAKETLAKNPFVKKDGLKGSGYYVEYRTDDARLTIEVMKKAVELGANAINYTKAEHFLYDDNKQVVGVTVTDRLSGKAYDIKGHRVINAAGPWVDKVRKLDYATNNKHLRLTKGIHLVIDKQKFPMEQAVYFDTPDGRMVFAIPRDKKVYVGTTDTVYDEAVINPKALESDHNYVIKAINYMFPDVHITEKDIESSWAGVRPLIYEEGKDPSEISRKDEVWFSESGLITMAGGKLTGYRKMAEKLLDDVSKSLAKETGKKYKPVQTKHLPISGGDIGGSEQLEAFLSKKAKEGNNRFGWTLEEGREMAKRFGSNIDQLFTYAQEHKEQNETTLPNSLYAELRYSIQHEAVTTPIDFLLRRTGYLLFDMPYLLEWKDAVVDEMAKQFHWSDDVKQTYIEELNIQINDAREPADWHDR